MVLHLFITLKNKLIKFQLHIVLLLFSFSAFAQQQRIKNLPGFENTKKIHFGFYLGVNNLGVDVKYKSALLQNDTIYTALVRGQYGFNLGIVADIHLGDGFDLRLVPALVFGQRDFEYQAKVKGNIIENQTRIVESTYLDFPISLKYKSERVNNGRFFFLGGFKPAFDMASLKKVDSKNTKVVRLQPWELSCHVGFGVDLYFEYFKLSPQIMFNYGRNNLLIQDGTAYTSLIDQVKARSFVIALTFEG